jgi:protein involved in temperature-dependent protein secretion
MTLAQAKEIVKTKPTSKKDQELYLKALQVIAGSWVNQN